MKRQNGTITCITVHYIQFTFKCTAMFTISPKGKALRGYITCHPEVFTIPFLEAFSNWKFTELSKTTLDQYFFRIIERSAHPIGCASLFIGQFQLDSYSILTKRPLSLHRRTCDKNLIDALDMEFLSSRLVTDS